MSGSRSQLAGKAELAAFLAAHPDIHAVQIMITDPSGVLRGKAVRREELERIFDSGRQVAGSILGLDITGKDVDDTGLVWDTGDADMTARPIARHADARALARGAHRPAHAHHVRRRRASRPPRIRATRWCAWWSASRAPGSRPWWPASSSSIY